MSPLAGTCAAVKIICSDLQLHQRKPHSKVKEAFKMQQADVAPLAKEMVL